MNCAPFQSKIIHSCSLWLTYRLQEYSGAKIKSPIISVLGWLFPILRKTFRGESDKVSKGKGVILAQISQSPDFLRMLAKIAHSYASALVADIGPFKPFLLEIIRGGDMKDAANLIGGADKFMSPSAQAEQPMLHDIWLQRARASNDASSPSLTRILQMAHKFVGG